MSNLQHTYANDRLLHFSVGSFILGGITCYLLANPLKHSASTHSFTQSQEGNAEVLCIDVN